MHCIKCWEYTEDIKWLKEKSEQKLTDWSNFIIGIPDNLPNECWNYVRQYIMSVLTDIPNERFKHTEYHEFLNNIIHDIEFVKIALIKMKETAETREEKQNYRNVNKCIQTRYKPLILKKPIFHI